MSGIIDTMFQSGRSEWRSSCVARGSFRPGAEVHGFDGCAVSCLL